MQYVNKYTGAGTNITNIHKLVAIGDDTYVIGNTQRSQPDQWDLYIVKLDKFQNLVWEKGYIYPGTSPNGFDFWNQLHIEDLYFSGDQRQGLIALAYNQDEVFVLTINPDNGELNFVNKIYDRNNIIPIYQSTHLKARMHTMDRDQFVINVHEIHSDSSDQVKQIDYYLMNYSLPAGSTTFARRIDGGGIMLTIREEEVRQGVLHLFGGYAYETGMESDRGIIIEIDKNLNILKSNTLMYAYDSNIDKDNIDIFWTSPIHENSYMVMGSYHHFKPTQVYGNPIKKWKLNLSRVPIKFYPSKIPILIDWIPVQVGVIERYTHYFIAEISKENNQIIRSFQLEQDFSDEGDKTVHINEQGVFLSLDRKLFKLQSDLMNEEWCKHILPVEETNSLIPHRSIRTGQFNAYLDADGQTRQDIAFFLSGSPLTYQTCNTRPSDDNLKMKPLTMVVPSVQLTIVDAQTFQYSTPRFLTGLKGLAIDRLCKWSEGTLPVGPQSTLQAPYLYIQAVGSTGTDSTEGIHIRWHLAKELANHLPKGSHYTGGPQGFNQPDDYIHILRAPYQAVGTGINFQTPPQHVDDTQKRWGYITGGRTILIYFRNISKYNQVRSSINPANNPLGFVQSYGKNIIEVTTSSDEFFAFRLLVQDIQYSISTEVLSSETHGLPGPKSTTFRRTLIGNELNKKQFIDKGGSLRFRPNGSNVTGVYFEYYNDFIEQANGNKAWKTLGLRGLTLDDQEARERLEPNPDNHPVHAAWPRYGDGEFVNIENYVTKWKGPLPDPRNEIRNSVSKYIELSNDPDNPMANETFYLNDIPPGPGNPDQGLTLSHLTLLQMASMDYHVARMLGLGLSDFSSEVYGGQRYVYAAVYPISAELPNGGSYLIAVSIPTGINDNRPPIGVDLKNVKPGIYSSTGAVGELSPLTNEDGYTPDGKVRYISLFNNEIVPNEPANIAFYWSTNQFNLSETTYPVYAGIKYKKSYEESWRLPELPHNQDYRNVTDADVLSAYETVEIPIPDFGFPLYIHRITRSGKQIYSSYGIDWFSRVTTSQITKEVESEIFPANDLLPPSSCNALLIEQESPLLLTSQKEQIMYDEITSEDKAFIRLFFVYDSAQDMVQYLKMVNGEMQDDFDPLPFNEEIFANQIEIFFRPETPKQLFGTIASVSDDPNNPLISIIMTAPMEIYSAGETLYPEISGSEVPHYLGGVLTVGTDEFIIHHIEPNPANPLLPHIYVLKKNIATPFGSISNEFVDPTDYIAPEVGSSFMVVENMLNEVSWGNLNPHPFKVKIADMWGNYEEEVNITSGEGNDITINTYYRRFRGFKHNQVKISKYNDEFTSQFEGIYKLEFENFSLDHHPQYTVTVGNISVDWYRGSVRVPYENNPDGERKVLKIIRMENVGTTDNLIVYAQDEGYQNAPLQAANERMGWVNLYPGFRVYLYENESMRLTKEHLYAQDENVLDKYSIFGLRSRIEGDDDYISNISIPTMMFARKQDKPETPELPAGGIFATKPDYYGRSSFTFNTAYVHKPFALSFMRTSDDLLLSSLYKQTPYRNTPEQDSVEDIKKANDDNYYNDRLRALANGEVDGEYLFPKFGDYRFPIPNNKNFFMGINKFIDDHNNHYGDNISHIDEGSVTRMDYIVIPEVPGRNAALIFLDFVRQTIESCYLPLTELPIIYNYIKGEDYQPQPKKQVIRDRNGNLLQPTDPMFDIAPMVKILGTNPHKTQYTDFTLDGNSTSVYFYAVREVSTQMQQGMLSPAIGPVRMVNSYAIYAPEIVSIIPVLENEVLGVAPSVKITINAYDEIRKIKRLKLYRSFEGTQVNDVRTMELVKIIDLEQEGLLGNAVWEISDDFTDLTEIPFGDPLYYRAVAEVEIQYAAANYSFDDNDPNNTFDIITDYAPSEASKLIITTIVENRVPDSPVLTYTANHTGPSTLTYVVFHWEKQAYKGKYYLYKMNTQGNWVQIAMVEGDAETESFDLPLADTDLNTPQLVIQDAEGNPVYHHFKMLTENTAGMLSTNEVLLTIPS